ncbi:MAG TPA: phosphoribosyltransferase [Aquella sp.]|nr:phosphoribosyltransferase [Aquella sp.]
MYQLLKDRTEAGKLLAGSLINYKNATDTIVLALPRGGVPVAYEISMKLNLPMDLVIVRKLGHPGHEEYAMGAITFGDIFYINPDVAYKIDINAPDIQAIIKKERQEYFRRNQLYRNNKPMPDVKGKRIILVDDGVATGSSIIAAIMALKELSPKEIVVAVPILPPDTLSNLKSLVTKVIFLYTPEPFGSVGSWYEDFPQTEDDEVIKLCAKANK